MSRRFLYFVAVLALIAAGGAWYLNRSAAPAPDHAEATATAAAAAQVAGDATDAPAPAVGEMTLGDPDAPVTVIEYASFTCPHCRNFHASVFGKLKKNYIDTGKVYFIYREVYFDRYGLWAAMVARCGGEEKYFAIADLIYKGQQGWTASGDPTTIANGALRKIGRLAGITGEELDVCLQDGEMANALVAEYQRNAEADGINSTPSFVIDGVKYGNMAYDDFAAVLDEKLGL